MKRLLFLAIPLVLILSGCWLPGSSQDWNGDVTGTQIYILQVSQEGRSLVIKATIDTAKRDELIAAMGEDYQAPSELFFWMAPLYQPDRNTYGDPTIWPVARAPIPADDSDIVVKVNLEDMARGDDTDLHTGNLDGRDNDDMNGAWVFASDGYGDLMKYNDYQSTIYYKVGQDVTSESFNFHNSHPAGSGQSDPVKYPNADLSQTWTPIVLGQEGMFMPNYVRSGETFTVVVRLGGGDTTLSADGYITAQGMTDTTLPKSSATQDTEDDHVFTWQVQFGTGSDPNVIYIDDSGMSPFTYLNVDYQWYGAYNKYYIGHVTQLVATDFDGNNLNISPTWGGGALELWKSSEPYQNQYYQNIDPDPNATNWNIQELNFPTDTDEKDRALLPPVDPFNPPISGLNMLGIGVGGQIRDNYEDNRNDFVNLPAYNYYTDWNGAYANLYVMFKARVDMDPNHTGHDWVHVEIERHDYLGDPYWSWFGSELSGQPDTYQLEQNNGWRFYYLEIPDYYLEDTAQNMRIQFQSDGAANSQGVLIDDFEISLVK